MPSEIRGKNVKADISPTIKVKQTITGPSHPITSTVRFNPKIAVATAATTMIAVAIGIGTPHCWLNVDAPPEHMKIKQQATNSHAKISNNFPAYFPA